VQAALARAWHVWGAASFFRLSIDGRARRPLRQAPIPARKTDDDPLDDEIPNGRPLEEVFSE